MRDTTLGARLAALAAAGGIGAAAAAQPLFSVANNGPSGLLGDAVFQTVSGVPVQVGGGPGMGLGRAGDDITGLSPVVVPTIRATQDFVIDFGVDVFAVGKNRFRITEQNLLRQALNHQQAGDAYYSTEAFRRGVGVLPPPFSMGLENNALVVNQSENYPNAFGLEPQADPGHEVPPGTPLDDVDAMMRMTDLTPPMVFFTLSGESPSHLFLPGLDSGATIFFDQDFQAPGTEEVYAEPFQLGLDPLDEISGVIVLDDNLNYLFDGTDTVYLSLAPGSPTLTALGLQPGDVLVVEQGVLGLFAPGTILGLQIGDNMDALDMVPLVNGTAENTINAMVDCPADYNDDTFINTLDVLAFLNGWVSGDDRADFNGDGQLDTVDVLVFLDSWAGGC